MSPFRLDEFRAKVQFCTSAEMPMLVYEACLKTQVASNTLYYQIAVCEKLAHDLDLDLDELLSHLPVPMTAAAHLFNPYQPHPLGISSRKGYGHTNPEVH